MADNETTSTGTESDAKVETAQVPDEPTLDGVVIRTGAPEQDGVHYYDAPDVRPVDVSVGEERHSQIVSVTVDEQVDPKSDKAVQVPRESLGDLSLPLHSLALGTPQEQLDRLSDDEE